MNLTLTNVDLRILAPLILLAGGACLVLVLDLIGRPSTRRLAVWTTGAVLAASFAAALAQYGWLEPARRLPPRIEAGPLLAPMWRFQIFTVLATLVVTGITFLVFLLGRGHLGDEDRPTEGEFHVLLLLFAAGTVIVAGAKNLMLAFIGLETFSVALYVLVALRRRRSASVEAGIKYFLLGAFAAAVFLYGSALVYAGRGSLDLPELGSIARAGLPAPAGLAAVGGGLLFVALFFKASVAPFHMWTPDVYEGAPTPVTALMSTGTKAAAFVLLLSAARFYPHEILPLIPALAVLSILVGNAGALFQTDVKRLLAYSGVAHAGYLLVAYDALAVGQGPQDAAVATRAILFYLAVYGITNLAAFGVVAWLEAADERAVTLAGLRGLHRRNPFCAAVLGLAALSLAGIPPTAGFWAKYQVFAAAVQAGRVAPAVAGILGSVVGLYYYLRILVALYFEAAEDQARIPAMRPAGALAFGLSGAALLVFGFFPSLILDPLVHVRL